MAMVRSRRDPTTDPVAPRVIAAFEKAQAAGLTTSECYKAGVEVWRRAHPDHAAVYASQQAVEVILQVKTSWQIGTNGGLTRPGRPDEFRHAIPPIRD